MKKIKRYDAMAKYATLVGFLFFYILSLYRGVTTITDEMERGIRVWTDVLMLITIIGVIFNLLVIERFTLLITGRKPNIFNDLVEQDSKEFSASHNGEIVSPFILASLLILIILYMVTKNRLFLFCSGIFSIIFVLGTLINVFAVYLKVKKAKKSVFSTLLNPVILPMLIFIIQIFTTRKETVGFVYQNLYEPQSTVILILTLLLILTYVLATAFCHFTNIYCLIAFTFNRYDSERIQAKINAVQAKNEKREDSLRQIANYVDEKAEQVGFLRRISLMFPFINIHIKAYFKERYYAVCYLILYCSLQLKKWLSGLLESECIKNNLIYFCEVTVVFELLTLDMLLFIYLGSEDPCSRFFELLSTVIIIPILLSSLANLKANKLKKE